ncbi:permease [Pseudanabaena sp. FACHB-1998]|uniref:permease n=1 Tax=Pseudanabaena sp. FACHB-1998 TaxID=2692858 RepID=UPI001680ECA4|nr:permease [Pseudanabaena sp. FACHB-1998]MBD2177952.1 permease [Pseudanabaena sp. FACHB-1998]
MNQLLSAFTLFLSLLVEAIPFLMMGVLLSGALLIFVDERKLIAILPKNPLLGALAGSLLGFMFPVCECGNVPVARRLISQGAPISVAVSFLLAAPTINPVVIWATWTAFRDQPEIAVLRVVLSLAIATIVAMVFSSQKDLRPILQPNIAIALPAAKIKAGAVPVGTFFLGEDTSKPLDLSGYATSQSIATKSLPDRLNLLLDNTLAEMRELGAILVMGSAIAAIIQVWVPRDIILNLGQGQVSSIVAMMILAAIVSICSTVDAFFALSFASTFTSGSLLAFLVFGPTIDLKAIGLILTIFQKRAVIYMFLLTAQLTFLSCLFINFQIR